MKVLLNYANKLFLPQQQRNSATGRSVARFDRVFSFGPSDIDAAFVARNKHILQQARGNGYWLWKPYFLCRTLESLAEDDFLFYCDSGAHFVAPIDPLIEICRESGQDVIPFELPYPEQDWTKRDAFLLLGCDQPRFTQSRQRLASFHLWRKSDSSLLLARQWLDLAQDQRLLTDLANQCGQPNYDGFQHHRHDQSLFSLLTKQHGLTGFRNPSQHGDRSHQRYPNSPYGQIVAHTRRESISLGGRIMRKVRKTVRRLSAWWTWEAEQTRRAA